MTKNYITLPYRDNDCKSWKQPIPLSKELSKNELSKQEVDE